MNATVANTRPKRKVRKQRTQRAQAIALIVVCAVALAGVGALTAALRDDVAIGRAPISVFSLVDTGIVYVDPASSEVVWRSDRGARRTIGDAPWTYEGPVRLNENTGLLAWRENRDIVGHPDLDLVSWVESVDGEPRGLVVVRASTGDVLARTAIRPPNGHAVVIASVDEQSVYFATPNPTTGFPDLPGPDIWVWSWTAGEGPRALFSARYYNDVSAGTWAVYGNGVEFEDADGQRLATFDFSDDEPTDFGAALSPDGRYWYGAGTSSIVETTTGRAVKIPAERERNYAWTGSAELTLTEPSMVCSAVTGQCRGPAGVPVDLCVPFGVVCGNSLPVN